MYSNELICNILDYINKNIDTEITIDLLSNLFLFNRTYIMKKFKKELNISIINYINTLKIYNSLSKYNQQSITTIALTSGFNSLEYYS
jgi:YesN/AraC family two-component response regulator